MPHADQLRGEIFHVGLDAALHIWKTSKTENIDLAFSHCVCSRNCLPIFTPDKEISVLVVDAHFRPSDRHPAQQLCNILDDGSDVT